MKRSRGGRTALLAATLVALGACETQSGEAGGEGNLETADQQASYGIGYNVGANLVPMAERIDTDALVSGLRDAMQENDPDIPQEELQQVLQTFQMELQQAQQQAMAAEAETNQAAADSFMAAVAEREDVTMAESGLGYEVVEQGEGATPDSADQVTVHYRGTLPDGTQFDSSYDRGEPATFSLQGVIPGFAEGIGMMPVGSTYRLYIPPALGYGPRGAGPDIPPNSPLIFEVELLEIAE